MGFKNKNVSSKSYRPARRFPLVVIIGGIALILLAGGGAFYWNSVRHRSPAPTANSETKGEPQGGDTTGSTSSSSDDNPTSSDDKNTGGSTATLIAPSGNFVSNHHPNLSGSPAPNQIQSVCNTTPGAQCEITFTNGTDTKSLPAQTTDKGGATYWTWKVQDIGLTAGSWKVQATSKLGSDTKTADDAILLEVRP